MCALMKGLGFCDTVKINMQNAIYMLEMGEKTIAEMQVNSCLIFIADIANSGMY